MEVGKKEASYDRKFFYIAATVIGLLVTETVFLHIKIYQTDSELSRKIDQLERTQRLTEKKLKEAQSGNGALNSLDIAYLSQQLKSDQLKSRSRRHIERNLEFLLRVLKGAHNPKLQCKNVTLVCRKGDRGAPGNSGPSGPKGAQGERGAIGFVGMKGAIGQKGGKGLKGDTGLHGAKGDMGQKGEIGSFGPPGPKGSKGEPCLPPKTTPKECLSLKKGGLNNTGIYTVDPDNGTPFFVYCDMENEGGGWTVIQRRTDGSVDFFRNWQAYKTGFGDLENEFWLGNEKIHRLTKRKNMKIRFDLEAADGSKAFAEYSTFYIDGEDKQFTLHIGSYSGTAGDSFSLHNGHKFSTKDRDHDAYPGGSCAVGYHGAWWYEECHVSNLNGKYLNGPHKSYADGVNWYAFKGYHNSLKRTVIRIKPCC